MYANHFPINPGYAIKNPKDTYYEYYTLLCPAQCFYLYIEIRLYYQNKITNKINRIYEIRFIRKISLNLIIEHMIFD